MDLLQVSIDFERPGAKIAEEMVTQFKRKNRTIVVHNSDQICCCGLSFHTSSLSSL